MHHRLSILKKKLFNLWNESPVAVRCTILDPWGRCTGTTQRDGTRREEGGGFRMGNTCITVADTCWYMAKPIQYCKVKKKKTGVGCYFFLQCMKVKSESEVALSCPTLNDPTDCSLPGSSVHGCFQARVLEWVTIAFSVFQLKSLLFFLLSSW